MQRGGGDEALGLTEKQRAGREGEFGLWRTSGVPSIADCAKLEETSREWLVALT